LKNTASWRRDIELREDHAWRDFHFGCWINPSLADVHPCIVECTMRDFLVDYLYGHMSLFYVSLPHLLVYIREESVILFIITNILFFVLVLDTLGFMRNP